MVIIITSHYNEHSEKDSRREFFRTMKLVCILVMVTPLWAFVKTHRMIDHEE